MEVRSFADGRSLPGCVADQPWRDGRGRLHQPKRLTPYRGIDHVRCEHGTPLPRGYHACEGDTGCQFRLKRRRYCPYHEDLVYDLDDRAMYEALTGLPPSPRVYHVPWRQP